MKGEKLNTISDALDKVGKSQKEIADHFGININTVSRWCNNKQQPTLSMFFRLSEYLSMPVFSLIRLSSPIIISEESVNEKVAAIDSVIGSLNEIKQFMIEQIPAQNETPQ